MYGFALTFCKCMTLCARTHINTHTQSRARRLWGSYWSVWPKGQPVVAVDSFRLALNIWYSQLTFAQDNQTWLMSPALCIRLWVSDRPGEKGGKRDKKNWSWSAEEGGWKKGIQDEINMFFQGYLRMWSLGEGREKKISRRVWRMKWHCEGYDVRSAGF